MQSYYETPRISDLKRPRIFGIFIYTNVNIQMVTIHPRVSIIISFIFTNRNKWVIVNHPRCKHHPKILPHVTLICQQSHTTMHNKIHPYALVHKRSPIKPAIWLSIHLYIGLTSTRKHILSHYSQKIHKFLKTWQRHVTSLKTHDGDVPTTRNALVNSLHHHLTLIDVQVHYIAV